MYIKYDLLGKLALSVEMSMISLMHHGVMNGAHDEPRLDSSGPIILTLSRVLLAPDSF